MAQYNVGDKVKVALNSKDTLGWIVALRTTKEHFIRYRIRLDDTKEIHEVSFGQIKALCTDKPK